MQEDLFGVWNHCPMSHGCAEDRESYPHCSLGRVTWEISPNMRKNHNAVLGGSISLYPAMSPPMGAELDSLLLIRPPRNRQNAWLGVMAHSVHAIKKLKVVDERQGNVQRLQP